MDDLLVKLYDIGALKTGSFKLKSGIVSPIYVDLRVIISYPDVMRCLVEHLCKVLEQNVPLNEIKSWKVCGVPYTALPLATLISMRYDMPMIMRRKEKKEHGTAQMIEGKYEAGDKVLIIEDLVTTGASVLETAADLIACGLNPSRALLFLDRGHGGINRLKEQGIEANACTSLHHFLNVLVDRGRIESVHRDAAIAFVTSTPANVTDSRVPSAINNAKMIYANGVIKRSLAERARLARNDKTKQLFELMQRKRTNLIVAADVDTGDQVLELAKHIGECICVLKLHYDVLSVTSSFFDELKKIAIEKQFMLMEDRKYADIGAIVQRQLTGTACGEGQSMATWADFVTVHAISGSGTLKAVRDLPVDQRPGVILVAEMSTAENIISTEYTRKTVEIGMLYQDVVSGFVAQSNVLCDHGHAADADSFIQMTPGVSLSAQGDKFGQQYRTPVMAVKEGHADCVIVGRGIYAASNPSTIAQQYRDQSIDALLEISCADQG